VQSSSSKSSELQELISSDDFQWNPPSSIGHDFFEPGYSYHFAVKMCNFLGICSEGTHVVLVLTSVLPSVTIPGDPLRMVKRSIPLQLISSAFVATCNGFPLNLFSFFKVII
jgi:hypothetical protein